MTKKHSTKNLLDNFKYKNNYIKNKHLTSLFSLSESRTIFLIGSRHQDTSTAVTRSQGALLHVLNLFLSRLFQ